VEDIAVSMMRAMGDSKLRDQLRHNGLRRSAEFSWNRCALETLRIFSAASNAR